LNAFEPFLALKETRPIIEPSGYETYIAQQKETLMSGMKSAYELAMERAGGAAQELSDAQKSALADIDAKMKAKVAEAEIMFAQQLGTETDPAKASFVQQTRQDQITKIKAQAEADKESIRSHA
jgi:hypothetical protein